MVLYHNLHNNASFYYIVLAIYNFNKNINTLNMLLLSISNTLSVNFAPSLISSFVPFDILEFALPGTANTSFPSSSASSAVIKLPLFSPASTTTTPSLIPLIILFRLGKFCGTGTTFSSYSVITAPPYFIISSINFIFSFGYM